MSSSTNNKTKTQNIKREMDTFEGMPWSYRREWEWENRPSPRTAVEDPSAAPESDRMETCDCSTAWHCQCDPLPKPIQKREPERRYPRSCTWCGFRALPNCANGTRCPFFRGERKKTISEGLEGVEANPGPPADTTKIQCKSFLTGECKYSPCKWAHGSKPGIGPNACRDFFTKSGCTRKNCKFEHPAPALRGKGKEVVSDWQCGCGTCFQSFAILEMHVKNCPDSKKLNVKHKIPEVAVTPVTSSPEPDDDGESSTRRRKVFKTKGQTPLEAAASDDLAKERAGVDVRREQEAEGRERSLPQPSPSPVGATLADFLPDSSPAAERADSTGSTSDSGSQKTQSSETPRSTLSEEDEQEQDRLQCWERECEQHGHWDGRFFEWKSKPDDYLAVVTQSDINAGKWAAVKWAAAGCAFLALSSGLVKAPLLLGITPESPEILRTIARCFSKSVCRSMLMLTPLYVFQALRSLVPYTNHRASFSYTKPEWVKGGFPDVRPAVLRHNPITEQAHYGVVMHTMRPMWLPMIWREKKVEIEVSLALLANVFRPEVGLERRTITKIAGDATRLSCVNWDRGRVDLVADSIATVASYIWAADIYKKAEVYGIQDFGDAPVLGRRRRAHLKA
jgi:hypothetical protein